MGAGFRAAAAVPGPAAAHPGAAFLLEKRAGMHMIKGGRNPGGMVPMRRTAAIVVLAVLACTAAFAQQDAGKDVYVKSVRIARVYPNGLGYRILYLKSTLEYAEMYVPTAWLSFAGDSKANVIWGSSDEFPYLSIYYVNGKFDRILLFLHSNMHDVSWGTLPPGIDLSSQFNVQEPPRDF
jgi:hypothetical protein